MNKNSFALLDDCHASPAHPTSRLYTELQEVLHCTDPTQFDVMLEHMQSALQQGYFAVALLTYELGVQLHHITTITNHLKDVSSILLYRRCQHLSQDQVTEWLQQQTSAEDIAGIAALNTSITKEEFVQAINTIQRYIVEGDTYQVNYTYRLHFHTYGTIFSLYQRLRKRQPVPFGALISLPDGSAILSFSPELFLRHDQGHLLARPMKGTSLASDDMVINEKRSQQLALDEKNRAENVMIVDLLRNDLSQIAQPGSVQVPQLFTVERFNHVLQMTSDITARCRQEVTLTELLKAVYPCGSITGAPKIRTMEIINEIENQARGIYTGVIGWFDPISSSTAIPDFCLSVPIRTLHLQASTSVEGIRVSTMGVGAGIVFDSSIENEYEECQLKAQFLTDLPAQFALFETMYATKEHGCRHWARHRQRLEKSAQYFGIPLNITQIEKQLATTCINFIDHTPYRLKLSVDGAGEVTIESIVLAPIATPVNVCLAKKSQSSKNIWLHHKTTQRALYDQAWKSAEQHGLFDMLFCNEQDELTEGARSNLLVKIAGRWYTPPLRAGVLSGVMRSVLMDDVTFKVTERRIDMRQLLNAEEIAVCNALRGLLPAKLCSSILSSGYS